MKLVIDASMALAWLFERENKKEAACANHALAQLTNAEVITPMLWHTEIANALLVAERRHVASEARVIDFLNKLYQLPITTDETSIEHHRDSMMALAREYDLTAYDATYLELALRSDAQLATFDNKLVSAMRKAGGIIFNGIS